MRSVTIWPFHNGNHSLQMTQTKQHFRSTLPFHGKSIRKNCLEVSSWLLVALLVIQAKQFFWQLQDHQKYQTCLAQTMKKRTQGPLLIISYCVNQYVYQRAVIQATDTDIFIMAIYYSVRIPGLKELWMQKRFSYIPCHIIANLLAEKFTLPVTLASSALLCGHIMSGCDTVSYVFGKDKKKSYKVAMANASDLTETMQFGDDTHDVTEAVTDVCRNIFLKLYGDFSGNLVELRAHMFGRIKRDIRQLPPTENAFRYHMLRALYKIIICKKAHMSTLSLRDATLFGWNIWLFGFHYDGQTGEAFVCQTQELLSV